MMVRDQRRLSETWISPLNNQPHSYIQLKHFCTLPLRTDGENPYKSPYAALNQTFKQSNSCLLSLKQTKTAHLSRDPFSNWQQFQSEFPFFPLGTQWMQAVVYNWCIWGCNVRHRCLRVFQRPAWQSEACSSTAEKKRLVSLCPS